MSNSIPGVIGAAAALRDADGHIAAWNEARADLATLAVVRCRQWGMDDERTAAHLRLPLAQVQAVRGIEVDHWYREGPDASLAVQYRNAVLAANGEADFVVEAARTPVGTAAARVEKYIHEHPAVTVPTLLALFENDLRFGWDINALVDSLTTVRADQSTGALYQTMTVDQIRNEVGFGSRGKEIWGAVNGGWARVTDAPAYMRSAKYGSRADRRQTAAMRTVIECIPPESGPSVGLNFASDEQLFVWAPAAASFGRGPVPPGWQRNEHGFPERVIS